jgi:ankyrin repeat protein
MTACRSLLAAFALVGLAIPAAAEKPAPVPVTPEVAAKLREIAFQAARDGDLKTLAAYLDADRPINEPNSRGDTLLIVAAYNGQEEAVAALLARPKVEVDARNKMGLTALAGAAFKGHAGIAKKLLKAGANPNSTSGIGQTALMFAALAGKTEVVRVLLDAGADPKATDKLGNTALSLARVQGADEVVALLEKAGK